MIGYSIKPEKLCSQESVNSLEVRILESEPWLVKTTENIRIPPRVKQMVVGHVEFPKRQETSPLVCVKPAQLPFECVLPEEV